MATLKDAKIGQTVRVKKLTGEGAVKRRIMDMGITKGVEVYIRKVAPLGDPIEGKRIDTRQVCDDNIFVPFQLTLFLFHGNTRPVTDELVRTC